MILASRQPNGKVHYFNAFTGARYKPGRETGTYLGHIPDDVIRFLSPKIELQRVITNTPAAARIGTQPVTRNLPSGPCL